MRSDMSKVIVERPRRQGYDANGKGRLQDTDLQVSHEGMRAPHIRNWGGKQLNENLAPLYRFLQSRVGQCWNDVFSEICFNIKLTSTVQKHVRDHLKHMVATNIWIDDQGEPWAMNNKPVKLSEFAHVKCWVDPRDGILKKNQAPTYKQRNQQSAANRRKLLAATARRLSDGVELRKLHGVWYQVTIEPIPAVTQRSYTRADGVVQTWEMGGSAYDVILETTVFRSRYYNGISTYCATKRQLSHVELRRYGVSND